MKSNRTKSLLKVAVPAFVAVSGLFLTATNAAADDIACKDVFKIVVTYPDSNSVRFQWMEHPSYPREAWVAAQNNEMNAYLRQSPNKKPIEALMRLLYDKPVVLQTEKLSKNENLEIVSRGLGKATDLVIENPKKRTSRVVFSNLDIKKNASFTVLAFSLSPKKEYAVVSMVQNGSLDLRQLAVIELATGRRVGELIQAGSQSVVWTGPKRFIFERPENADTGDTGLSQLNINDPDKQYPNVDGSIGDAKGEWSVLSGDKDTQLLNSDGRKFKIPYQGVESIVGDLDGVIYLQAAGKSRQGEIIAFHLRDSKITVVVPEQNAVVSSVRLLDTHLFVETYMNKEQNIEMFSVVGGVRSVGKIAIPDSSSINLTSLSWLKPGEMLEMKLTSDIVRSKKAYYDIKAGKFTEPNLNEHMLERDGIKFKSYVVNYPSKDGTMIPMRVTHRADFDGTMGAFVNVYGGFSIPDRMYPHFDPGFYEFIKRGGVLCDPAVRGGNELGEVWHTDATFSKKPNTLDDVGAIPDFLVSQKYAPANKIALMGTSNGGFVVAASGLRSYGKYSLVIPVNGVQDQLGKERDQDRKFGMGWSYEYGDSRTPEAGYLQDISPVELAKNPPPPRGPETEFLFINGHMDSRVDPSNTFKTVMGMKQTGYNVQMISVNNSGHWLASPSYQGIIGWRTNVVIWTKVYDKFGMTP